MKRLIPLFLLILTGCAPWVHVEGRYESPSHRFSLDAPGGWMRLDTEGYLFMSKDGPFLEYIMVQERPLDRGFQHTRKKLDSDMLPSEAAEVIVDEISSDRAILNFKLVENLPATVAGRDGFKLFFTYANRDGLRMKTLYYGLVQAHRFYSIRYTAAARYYCQKHMGTFEEVLKTFRVDPVKAAGLSTSRS
jgi:hypothetical protein